MTIRFGRRTWNLWAVASGLIVVAGCSTARMANVSEPEADAAPAVPAGRDRAHIASTCEANIRHVAAGDPDLMLFGSDPSRQMMETVPLPSGRGGSSVSLQQQTFGEVGRDFDPDIDSSGKMVVFASTRHRAMPNLYLQAVKGRAVTQLTDDAASQIQPRFSPDGKKIAFASDRNGQWDIFILDLDRRTTTQVTHCEDHELAPAWSPDGRWLAYSRLSGSCGVWELWLASMENGAEQCIGQGLMPRFSPDGQRIAYQRPRDRDGRLFSIWTVQLSNGEPGWPTEVAAEPDAALICPVWSADGAKIAYCRVPAVGMGNHLSGATARPGLADLFMVDAEGSERVRLTDGGASFGPSWSSEGRLYFSADRDGRERIWSLKTAGPARPNLASTAMAVGEQDAQKGTHPQRASGR